MLNDKNLCDLYIAAGEASLSEVCTDFPRFGIEYRNVEQKCLSLACEEVCRIFFSKTKPVKFVEQELLETAMMTRESQRKRQHFLRRCSAS